MRPDVKLMAGVVLVASAAFALYRRYTGSESEQAAGEVRAG
jgi:hypothetical protein